MLLVVGRSSVAEANFPGRRTVVGGARVVSGARVVTGARFVNGAEEKSI